MGTPELGSQLDPSLLRKLAGGSLFGATCGGWCRCGDPGADRRQLVHAWRTWVPEPPAKTSSSHRKTSASHRSLVGSTDVKEVVKSGGLVTAAAGSGIGGQGLAGLRRA
jgi:hypothetical protein